MSLLDREDILDNNQFFLFIDVIKRGITSGDMKPVDDNPASQNQFFFIPMNPWERIFFKPL